MIDAGVPLGRIASRILLAMRAPMVLIASLLALALASFVFVRVESGAGDAFVVAQRQAQALTPAGVERVLRAAPDPVGGRKGRRAVCSPLGQGELHNPWRCVIDYADGRRIRYMVQIRLNGSYRGTDEVVTYQGRTYSDTGQITGCCILVP